MHNWETATILHTISAHCLCLRSINALFCLCLPEEQLEEDKLHSNGGKVLSSELENNHSGCSPFQRCVSESVLCPSFQAAGSVPACVLTHSALLLFCSGTCFSRSIHLCFNLFHISTSERHRRRRRNTNTCTSDNSKVNSSLPEIWAPSPGHSCFPRWQDHFYCRNQEVKLIALRLNSLHNWFGLNWCNIL